MRSWKTIWIGLVVWAVVSVSSNAQVVLWGESFDAVTPPALPAEWTTMDAGWVTSGVSASTGSGLNNLAHLGSLAGTATTPVLDLTEVIAADLVFLARRTASYDAANMAVSVSIDGGASYATTLLGPGQALPALDSRYEEMRVALPATVLGAPHVQIRFEGMGGSSSSASARIDDVRLEGEGSVRRNTFGLLMEHGSTMSGTVAFSIPLALRLVSAPAGLQGLQFAVTYDPTVISALTVVPGPAVAGSLWRLESELSGSTLKVVLVGEGQQSLPEGDYESLLMLEANIPERQTSTSTSLSLSGLIGASGDPGATDIPLAPMFGSMELSVEAGYATFLADQEQIDFGSIRAGQTAERDLVVTNFGGTIDLTIQSVGTTDPLFTVLPTQAAVPPGESATFRFAVSPLLADVGSHQALARFEHNAGPGLDEVPLSVIVGSGRGDVDGDGSVDLLDLILAIDLVLGRIDPITVDAPAADLYPFDAGDGQYDVRDLTVLSQAIARGEWPDGMPIDAYGSPGKVRTGTTQDVVVVLERTPEAFEIALELDRPLRGAHVLVGFGSAAARKSAVIEPVDTGLATLVATPRSDEAAYSLLLYRLDGGLLEPGRILLATVHAEGEGKVTLQGSLVVGPDLRKLTPATEMRWSIENPQPEPATGLLAPPFPSPFHPAVGRLQIPVHRESDQPIRIDVLDARGAMVRMLETPVTEGIAYATWDGRDTFGRLVAPGLYFVRATTDKDRATRAIVVVR